MTPLLRRIATVASVVLVAAAAGTIAVPQVLAFPYYAESQGSRIWSETPLPQPMIDAVMARSRSLVTASPIADPAGEQRDVFLTRGGWRWTMLALQNRRSFALSRPINNAIVINRSDVVRDRMDNVPGGSSRSLSSIIAHEFCHGMERRRFGFVRSDILASQRLREGYCDHVAQESTLTAADVARLRAEGRTHPALPYYEGRLEVVRTLAANGGDVDALFGAD